MPIQVELKPEAKALGFSGLESLRAYRVVEIVPSVRVDEERVKKDVEIGDIVFNVTGYTHSGGCLINATKGLDDLQQLS